jgi:amidase
MAPSAAVQQQQGGVVDRRSFIQAIGAASLASTSSEPVLGSATGAAYDPTERTFASLQQALSAGVASSESLTTAYLARIARYDRGGPEYRSVLALNPDALASARALDAERRAGKLRGPLHGLPILLKDNIETADPVPTTAGSLALARSTHKSDAALARRLRAAGVVVLGKTNLSEWANWRSTHSISGWSGVGGQTRNAYARDRNPSGSSAGSAVAAAASFCAAAIGSETDGSILAPASVNGLVGLKPTIGLVSGQGVVPISPRQDTAGPMGRSVADVAALAAVIAEHPLGFSAHGTDLEAFRLRGVRIGVLPVPKDSHPDAARHFAEQRAAFEREGAVLVDLKNPAGFEEMDAAETAALQYEFKAAINEYLAGLDPSLVGSRTLAGLIAFNQAHASEEMPLFGQEIFEASQERGPLTDPEYRKAIATLARVADAGGLAALLAQQSVELLLAPGNGPADRIDEIWGDRPGDGGWPGIASAAAVAGYPSLTVPSGMIRGLPVGIILVGNRNQDGLLLQVGRAYERATAARVPPTLTT